MKQRLITGILSLLWLLTWGQEDTTWTSGLALYEAGMYQEAFDRWSFLIDDEKPSATLQYNLGNAAYKAGKYPEATYHYFRAVRLAPLYSDGWFNLQLAISKVPTPVGVYIPLEPQNSLEYFVLRFPSQSWGICAIIANALILACFITLFLVKNKLLKYVFFSMTPVLLALGLLCLLAGNMVNRMVHRRVAFVQSKEAYVFKQPDDNGEVLLKTFRGNLVEWKKDNGEWLVVILADGQKGFMFRNEVELLP